MPSCAARSSVETILNALPNQKIPNRIRNKTGKIRAASTRVWPARAKFVCERVSQYTLSHREYFDVVLALGIVHHLDDSEALQLFQIAHSALKRGGKLVTLDGVWTNDQSRPARYLLARDRGQFVRSQEQYVNLASQVFSTIKASIRHDLLRIPYTHIILECIRGQEPTPKVNESAEKKA